MQIEISKICNLKCRMCYTITDHFKSRIGAGLMDFGLFKKIADEIVGKVYAVRLSLRGEPTLHPDLIECVKYVKKRGVCEVSFLTNGSRLTKDYFRKLMDAGVDWITVSVDGLNETYEKIREPLKFRDTFQKIADMKAMKDEYNKIKPVIKIQAVWPSIRENPEEFYNTFKPYVDLIAFNPLIDYLGMDKDGDVLYEEGFLCPQHYQRLVIGTGGLAMMCSNDEEGSRVVGDANVQGICDIWHGMKLNKMRELHKKRNGFLEIPVCRKCYLPRLTEDTEMSIVSGREFIVKNYVNRKQVVGE